MQDTLFRGVIADLDIRFAYTLCTDAVNEAVLRHNCDPLAAHVLCRALGAGVLCAPLLTGDEKLTLRWQYGGAVKAVMVDVDSSVHVRGFIHPTNLLNEVDEESKVYGEAGTVSVVKSDARQTLNTGAADAALLDVVEDLSFFFAVSDQIETAMNVMVGFSRDTDRPVNLCQGMMLQALPGCDLERFETVRKRLSGEHCRNLLSQPTEDPAKRFEALASSLLPKRAARVTQRADLGPVPSFRCNCSREKMVAVLTTLSVAELEDVLNSEETLNISCQFCGDRHRIGQEHVQAALAEKTDAEGAHGRPDTSPGESKDGRTTHEDG